MSTRTRLAAALLVGLCSFGLLPPAGAVTAVTDQDVYAHIEAGRIVLGNSVVERVWTAAPFGNEHVLDKRTGFLGRASSDFRLGLQTGLRGVRGEGVTVWWTRPPASSSAGSMPTSCGPGSRSNSPNVTPRGCS